MRTERSAEEIIAEIHTLLDAVDPEDISGLLLRRPILALARENVRELYQRFVEEADAESADTVRDATKKALQPALVDCARVPLGGEGIDPTDPCGDGAPAVCSAGRNDRV